MKQPIFIQNIPIDEKRISFIEKVVTRLARRTKSRTSAMVTPYPISACVKGNIKGNILRYMFPLDGTIDKAIISFDKKPKEIIYVGAKVGGEGGISSKGFTLEKKHTSMTLPLQVKAGDKLSVNVDVSDNEVVDEIWIAFTWIPNVKDTKLKTMLIEELEKDL